MTLLAIGLMLYSCLCTLNASREGKESVYGHDQHTECDTDVDQVLFVLRIGHRCSQLRRCRVECLDSVHGTRIAADIVAAVERSVGARMLCRAHRQEGKHANYQ